MVPPYRIHPNITNKRPKKSLNTNFDKTSSPKYDLKIPQMTSNDLVKADTNTESIIKRTSNKRDKNIPKDGSVMRILKITINIWMKFSTIITYKWNWRWKLIQTINQ